MLGFGVGPIGISKGSVLIGSKRELAAGHAPECKPGPGTGCRSVLGHGEVEQSRCDRIAVQREDTADVLGFKPGLNQSNE